MFIDASCHYYCSYSQNKTISLQRTGSGTPKIHHRHPKILAEGMIPFTANSTLPTPSACLTRNTTIIALLMRHTRLPLQQGARYSVALSQFESVL